MDDLKYKNNMQKLNIENAKKHQEVLIFQKEALKEIIIFLKNYNNDFFKNIKKKD